MFPVELYYTLYHFFTLFFHHYLLRNRVYCYSCFQNKNSYLLLFIYFQPLLYKKTPKASAVMTSTDVKTCNNKILDFFVLRTRSVGINALLFSLLTKNEMISLIKTSSFFDLFLGKGNKLTDIDTARVNHFITLERWTSIAILTPWLLYLFPSVFFYDWIPSSTLSVFLGGQLQSVSFASLEQNLLPLLACFVKNILIRHNTSINTNSVRSMRPNPIAHLIMSKKNKVREMSFNCIMEDNGRDRLPTPQLRMDNVSGMYFFTDKNSMKSKAYMSSCFFQTMRRFYGELEMKEEYPLMAHHNDWKILNIRLFFENEYYFEALQETYQQLKYYLSSFELKHLRLALEIRLPLNTPTMELLHRLCTTIGSSEYLKSLCVTCSITYRYEQYPKPTAKTVDQSKLTVHAYLSEMYANPFVESLRVVCSNVQLLTQSLLSLQKGINLKSLDFELNDGDYLHVFPLYQELNSNHRDDFNNFFNTLSDSKFSSVNTLRLNAKGQSLNLMRDPVELPFVTRLFFGCVSPSTHFSESNYPELSVDELSRCICYFPNLCYLELHIHGFVYPDCIHTLQFRRQDFIFLLQKVNETEKIKTFVFHVEFMWKHGERGIQSLNELFTNEDMKQMNEVVTSKSCVLTEVVLSLHPSYHINRKFHDNACLPGVTQADVDAVNAELKKNHPNTLSRVLKYSLSEPEYHARHLFELIDKSCACLSCAELRVLFS